MVSHLVNSCAIPLGFLETNSNLESCLEILEMRPPPLEGPLPDVVTNRWCPGATPTRTPSPPADAPSCLLRTPTPTETAPVQRVAVETPPSPEREARREAGRALRRAADLFASSASPTESWLRAELRSSERRLYMGLTATVVLGVMIFKCLVPR